MSDVYTQESASKKKFLAPLLVILLCMVSLTAAGYAYSATVDNSGNSGDLDGVTMELTGTFQDNGSMYAITGLDLATHITNGKALWLDESVGFAAAEGNAYSTYGDGEGEIEDIADFATGYYVQMVYGNNEDIGYHAASERENVDFTANTATLAGKGIYKVGENFTLNIKNKTDAAVTLKGDITGFTDKVAGIADVYLVVKNGAAVVGSVKLSDGAGLANIGSVAVGEVPYTVEAYIALSDYYSGEVPTIPAEAYTFDVKFAAATA